MRVAYALVCGIVFGVVYVVAEAVLARWGEPFAAWRTTLQPRGAMPLLLPSCFCAAAVSVRRSTSIGAMLIPMPN